MKMALLFLGLVCGQASAGSVGETTIWRGQATEAFTSEEYRVGPFDRAVLSWNASGATAFELEASGAWHLMGTWGDRPRSAKSETVDVGPICSPPSCSMVLEFHGVKRMTREVCEGVYDHAERIYGNWPLNTAYAHKAGGFESYVVRAGGLEEIEEEIAAGRPVVLSH